MYFIEDKAKATARYDVLQTVVAVYVQGLWRRVKGVNESLNSKQTNGDIES